jgi:hypothetical protein
MTIQEAVQTAIAGGYQMQGADGGEIAFSGANNAYSAWTRTDTQSSFLIPVQETLLDLAFWRALGRALGWDVPCDLAITCVHGDEECQRCHGYYWMYQWHCCIQHIPTVSPLVIPLVYCYINKFQRASSMEKPWPGGEKRRDGRAAHPVAW